MSDADKHGGPVAQISDDDFDRILGDILHEEGRNLLTIPGVYEAVSEHFNNDVLARWGLDRQ